MYLDHKRKLYKHKKDMCATYGISTSVFCYRRKKGYSIEEALTKELKAYKRGAVDHLNNKFSSKKKMCDHWNVSINTYYARRRKGASLQEALDPKKKL